MNNFFDRYVFGATGGCRRPPLWVSVVPVGFLLCVFAGVILTAGAGAIASWSVPALLLASAVALVLSRGAGSLTRRGMVVGFSRSARQLLPAVVMLVFISTVATTWMLSGVVPTLMDYGIRLLNPRLFLVVCCLVSAGVSVLTGSSWSTIATVGVAFMGIGSVMGYSEGWIAGAVISGAYFGDKVSPLSDTTVVASSACGVDIFKHIRYMMQSSVPALVVALAVYAVAGISGGVAAGELSEEMAAGLESVFNITPYVLVIPAATVVLLLLRLNTTLTLALSSAMGVAGMFVFQPDVAGELIGGAGGDAVRGVAALLWDETLLATGNPLLDELVATSGIVGMASTIALVVSAMVFGTVMIGTGMLGEITRAITRRLCRRMPVIGTTVASGLFLNSCTADQYLSLIIGGNMFRDAYRRTGMEGRLLSRTLEDSVSVTSVLIPWNSCGVTHSAVLGVATVVYFPFCIFNWLSPMMTLLLAWTGVGIRRRVRAVSTSAGLASARA